MRKGTIVEVVGGLGVGGVENFLFNYLSRMDPHKYNIIIISHEEPDPDTAKKFQSLGCKIYQIPPKRESLSQNLKALYRIFKTTQPDIVHCHLSLSNYAALAIAKLCKVKQRVSHTHLYYPSKSRAQALYCKLVNHFATTKAACGKTAAHYLYGEKEPVQIFHNAITVEDFSFDPAIRNKTRKDLGIDEKTLLIGNVGRLRTQKNPLFLVKIFAEIHRLHPNSKLIFVGDGRRKSVVLQAIKQLNLENSVILAGNHQNAADFYQAMDVFVFPSNYEGLGMALIEAQISGLPCFASTAVPPETQITDLVQFINLQQPALYWAESILRTAQNQCERRSYQNEAAQAGYDINSEWHKLDDFYTKLLERNHGR